MEKNIGIVLPPDLKAEITQFGRNFGQRYNCDVIEPYIMLIPNKMLEGAKSVDRNLQSFCLSQPPFKTVVGGPNIDYGKEAHLLYLTVIMGSLNSVRNNLIKHLKLPHRSGMFRPAVLLAEQPPDGPYNFDEMLAEAKNLFARPQSIDVDALGIFARSGESESFAMSKLYPFTGR